MCAYVKISPSLNFCYWLFSFMFVILDEGMQRVLHLSGKEIDLKVSLSKMS